MSVSNALAISIYAFQKKHSLLCKMIFERKTHMLAIFQGNA